MDQTRACSKSFLGVVKPVTHVLFISYTLELSMDEKEAEAHPLMGTIFLFILDACLPVFQQFLLHTISYFSEVKW